MAREGVALRGGLLGALRGFNPLRATWWLFGNVRWAIALIVFIAAIGLLGVFLPQIPSALRGDPLGEAAWVDLQRDKFGPLTDWMHRVGLLDIFHARWFAVALGLLVASTAVYIVGRLPSLWWSIGRPRKRVPDRYFETAPLRASFATGAAAGALELALRRRWYAVECFAEGETTYLFADRFRWAELGTLLTHAAVIVFIVAAVVSRASGFSTDILIAEGTSAPVFAQVARPDQMQVQVEKAIGTFSADGQPLDYRSELAIFQAGQLVKRCVTTVNSPCTYNGYRFHQAAYFGFGAEVQVRDLASGNVIYRETLGLADTVPGPHLIVRDDSGNALLDQSLVLTESVEGIYGRLVTIPGDGRTVWTGVDREASGGWRLLVLEPSLADDAIQLNIAQGDRAQASGPEGRSLSFEFADLAQTPASFEPDFPLPPSVAARDPAGAGTVLVQMGGVVYGSGNASAGTVLDVPRNQGPPTLTMVGLSPQPLSLRPGESATIDAYEYTFLGQRDFAGIEVKRDRSVILVWIAAALLLVGLVISFWVPRRRIWAKIAGARTYLASQGGHISGFQREVRHLARALGAEPERRE